MFFRLRRFRHLFGLVIGIFGIAVSLAEGSSKVGTPIDYQSVVDDTLVRSFAGGAAQLRAIPGNGGDPIRSKSGVVPDKSGLQSYQSPLEKTILDATREQDFQRSVRALDHSFSEDLDGRYRALQDYVAPRTQAGTNEALREIERKFSEPVRVDHPTLAEL